MRDMAYGLDYLEMDFGSGYDYKSITYSQAFEFGLYTVNERSRRYRRMHFVKEEDLQTMCLNVIADNIEKFVKQYPKWDDEPERSNKVQIELLRRVYPDILYKMIKKKECFISSGVMDLLLTPYWNKVTMHSSDYSHDGLFRRLKTMGKTITSLNLLDSTASSDVLTAIICCVPNVVYLNFVGTECSDSVLALISKTCKSLVTLNLGECQKVTDVGIAHLYNLDRKEVGFNSLKALNINGTRVTEKSIPLMLKYLTSLEYLRYHVISLVLYDLYINAMISKKARYNLTSFEYNLWSVELPRYNDMDVYSVLEMWSVLCPHVTRICVKEKINKKFLKLCSKFKYLKVLRLVNKYTPIALSGSEFFRLRASQLTEIDVSNVAISIDIVVELCTNLKKLTLDSVTFKDFDMPAASIEKVKLNKLELLALSHADFKVEVVYKSLETLLYFSKNLVKLAIMYSSNFHEDVSSCIMNSPNLTTLNLSFTDIKPKFLSMFFASEKIKSICTDGCPYISRKCESLTSMNDNPQGNTCAWKIDFDYSDDMLPNEILRDIPWAGEFSI